MCTAILALAGLAATTAPLSDVLRCAGNPRAYRERLCAVVGPIACAPLPVELWGKRQEEEQCLGGQAI